MYDFYLLIVVGVSVNYRMISKSAKTKIVFLLNDEAHAKYSRKKEWFFFLLSICSITIKQLYRCI